MMPLIYLFIVAFLLFLRRVPAGERQEWQGKRRDAAKGPRLESNTGHSGKGLA